MGVSNYDKEKASKQYETKYILSTSKGVSKLLKDMHKIHSRAYERGDMAAIDLLVDLRSAVEKALLTDRQKQAVHYYYVMDYDQKTTAKLMGCDITTESRHRKAALERIRDVYIKWEYN